MGSASQPRRHWTALLLGLLGWVQALPAAAEGGAFPSVEAMVGLGLAYLLLLPMVATALAYGAVRLWRPARRFRWWRAFGWALLTWIVGMLVFNYSSLDLYLSDSVATALGGALALGAAVGATLLRAGAQPSAGK